MNQQEDDYGTETFRTEPYRFGDGLAVQDTGSLREFSTGATRDTSQMKLDPFGFISPLALHRFSEYMHKHRLQSDGKLRDSDNWKKGMPPMEYVRSLIRHVFDFWLVTSGLSPRFDKKVSDPQEIACAILFNVQGFLHETLQGPRLTATQAQYNSEWERKLADKPFPFFSGLSEEKPLEYDLKKGLSEIGKRPGLHPNVRMPMEKGVRMPMEKGEDQVRRMVDPGVDREVEEAFDRIRA